MTSTTRARLALSILSTLGVAATACGSFGSDAAKDDPGSTDVAPRRDEDAGAGDSGPPAVGMTAMSDAAAGDAASSPEAEGPWTPSRIKGLSLWLDGDAAKANVNGTVDTWNDKSSFKNDAKTTTDAQKPVLLAGVSSINGHQALQFDGVAKYFTIADSASLQWTQSFVIEAVFRHAQATSSEVGAIYSKATGGFLPDPPNHGPALILATVGSSPYPAYLDLAVGPPAEIVTSSTAGFPPGTHRVRASWDSPSNTLSLQIDKMTPVSAVKSGVTGLAAIGQDVMIGATFNNYRLKADIAEIVAVAGATVDPADVATLQSYLDTKYGL
jgi:hypothetical protein